MRETGTMGERIAAARRSRNLSQRQLAELVGVEANTISMYESNIRKPSVNVLKAIAGSLHVSTDYLLTGAEGKYINAAGLDEKERSLLSELAEILRGKNRKPDP